MSPNDPRGASVDLCVTKAKAKTKTKGGRPPRERLAHRGCNTGKGNTAPVIPWPDHLFVVDPAVILLVVERLERKGGREVMARCPSREDAQEAADWLVGRIGRLEPSLPVTAEIDAAGGQFLVAIRA